MQLYGRAANPKAILENVGQFSDENIAKIKDIAFKISAGTLELTASPSEKEAFSLTLTGNGTQQVTPNGVVLVSTIFNPANLTFIVDTSTTAGPTINASNFLASGIALVSDGGNILISDYSGKRLIEVDSDGNLVHELATGNWGIASVSLAR